MVSSLSKDFFIQRGVLSKYLGNDSTAVIPEGVARIGKDAFWNSSVISVEIPDSVTSIDKDAFEDCPNLDAKTKQKILSVNPGARF